jgi:hypothetical protein
MSGHTTPCILIILTFCSSLPLLPPTPPPSHPSPDVGLPFISRQADKAIVEAADRALVFATASPLRQSFARAKFRSHKVLAAVKVLAGQSLDRE